MIRAAFPIPCFALETKSLKCFKACDFHNIMAKPPPPFFAVQSQALPDALHNIHITTTPRRYCLLGTFVGIKKSQNVLKM